MILHGRAFLREAKAKGNAPSGSWGGSANASHETGKSAGLRIKLHDQQTDAHSFGRPFYVDFAPKPSVAYQTRFHPFRRI